MMGKFADDLGWTTTEDLGQPFIAGSLLAELGVYDSGVQAQAKALATWLESNTPQPALRRSLERAGFSYLLDDKPAA